MGKKYYWRFNIEESRFGEMYGLSCSDVVNEENKEVWSRFISDKISGLMREETLQDPEFLKTRAMVDEEKRQREEWRIRDERLRKKQWEERQRRKCMERPKITFIPKGLTVDYEKENDEEGYQMRQEQRRREFEERVRMAEEREAKSLIPLNPEYETEIFDYRNITWEFTVIDLRMSHEAKRVKALAGKGDYLTAATCFLQLTKSMCKHFIEDEHYNYFDDLYAPEYTIQGLVDYFNSLISYGTLPAKVMDYLHKGWAEIQTYEACTDYGLLHHCKLSEQK